MLSIPRPSLMLMKESAKTSAMIAVSFIRMLSAGPEVSLSGSPTVSPMTAALWHSDPFFCFWRTISMDPSERRAYSPVNGPCSGSPGAGCRTGTSMTSPPFSTNFLALSHAPPVLEAEMASWTPDTRPPARRPVTACTPKMYPVKIGLTMTRRPGMTISRRLASVLMAMQRAWSGGPCPGVPSRSPGMVSNCRFTSFTISIAASPTDFIVIAENQ
mmetsp:Transcript_24695/g.80759  ORF Transcript_24695/g.80759 Transcript_24695/m.80759 type:complete len:215 (-) Transcript_24695:1797-2441(-)